MGDLVRARSVLRAPGAARWLTFGLSRFPLIGLFLMPGSPAVGDLRQDFSDSFNVVIGPKTSAIISQSLEWWNWDLSCCDVSLEGNETQSKFFGDIASGMLIHLILLVSNVKEKCQATYWWVEKGLHVGTRLCHKVLSR